MLDSHTAPIDGHDRAVEGRCRTSLLEQFSCRPDTLEGTLLHPKWICVPVHRVFKLCPSTTSDGRQISVEVGLPIPTEPKIKPKYNKKS
ncbi:hypothetical protein PGT21_004426 [Puccinia graminis f. sp. tritici]|uniref:Uncharacterized protein n=1 Tax=Puccinia graminis f. sp. tritici TaxID=56615 RepID=A0A5B0LIT1_PUCGR|nr:hypothetical protein PGT21_004426 [Puccinia graminis f. sp. tritici]KAA1128455.1 hypothetical protein PGTUg99_009487 [Puccinia graminis f. sp. tritici]